MRHRAHLIVVTMPTDRSLGTMLSDSNDDVHTLQFAHRGECHRAVQGGDADRIPGFLQDESAGAIGRPSRAATAEFTIGGGPRRVHPRAFLPERVQVTPTTRRLTIAAGGGDPCAGTRRGRPTAWRSPVVRGCPWMSVDARPTKTLDSRPSLRRYLPSERSVGHGAVFVLHGSPHRDPDTDAYS
jgi:hypothetical protein